MSGITGCGAVGLRLPRVAERGRYRAWNDLASTRNAATAWLDQTKNGTPRGVPLNDGAVAVLEEQRGEHPPYCFTYRGVPK